jgi:nitrite reductase/ring-hydroxylating ferredoxin subunit
MTGRPARAAAVLKKDIPESGIRRFQFQHHGKTCEGIVVRRLGAYFAYLNECRHVPVSLDLSGGDFFSHDRQNLECSSHGALYEIETGLCIAGPCQGDRLVALDVQEEEKRLVIRLPEGFRTHGG